MTTRDERVAKVLAEVPTSARGILKRAFDGTGGRKNAIAAMCLACTGFDRETVRNCTGWSCPLGKWRPFQSSAETPPFLGVVQAKTSEEEAA
jgi:hypothetical protein